MKAIVYTTYGPPDVLEPREVEKPVPRDNEVLINVHATTVTAADYRVRGFSVSPAFWLPARLMFGVLKPRRTILGTEVSGVVTAVGRDVTLFKAGDPVFGLDSSDFGAYAEYVCRPEEGALAVKPANLTHTQAAAIPHGAISALFFLRDKGRIKRGQKVLIYGASGGVGTLAVQLAKHLGADVTGVCSTANLDLVKSLGADAVVDYTRNDFTGNGLTYDIIFDTVGKTSFSRCRGSLKRNGRYLLTVFDFPQMIQMLWTSMTGGRKVICAVAPERAEDLMFIKGLVEAGAIIPVIDRNYPLEHAAEAHRYADKGHKKGSVVITVRNDQILNHGSCHSIKG